MTDGADPQEGSQQESIPEGDWRLELPEEVRNHESLKPYKFAEQEDGTREEGVKVPVGLIKSYIGQQPLIGSKLIMPKEDDPPEKWNAFFAQLGRPESPDKYELPKDEAWEGIPYSQDLEVWFRESAYKYGLPAKTVTSLFQEYQGKMASFYEEAEKQMDQENVDATAELEKKWGSKFDDNLKISDRTFVRLFPNKELRERVRLILGNDIGFTESLYEMSKLIGEDGFVGEDGKSQRAVKSREELRKMVEDPRFETDPAYHAQVKAEYKKAYPG